MKQLNPTANKLWEKVKDQIWIVNGDKEYVFKLGVDFGLESAIHLIRGEEMNETNESNVQSV